MWLCAWRPLKTRAGHSADNQPDNQPDNAGFSGCREQEAGSNRVIPHSQDCLLACLPGKLPDYLPDYLPDCLPDCLLVLALRKWIQKATGRRITPPPCRLLCYPPCSPRSPSHIDSHCLPLRHNRSYLFAWGTFAPLFSAD